MKKTYWVIFFVLCLVSVSWATDYYVSPAGSDRNAGTSAEQA